MVGCPASGSSVPGVKIRMRTSPVPSGGTRRSSLKVHLGGDALHSRCGDVSRRLGVDRELVALEGRGGKHVVVEVFHENQYCGLGSGEGGLIVDWGMGIVDLLGIDAERIQPGVTLNRSSIDTPNSKINPHSQSPICKDNCYLPTSHGQTQIQIRLAVRQRRRYRRYTAARRRRRKVSLHEAAQVRYLNYALSVITSARSPTFATA